MILAIDYDLIYLKYGIAFPVSFNQFILHFNYKFFVFFIRVFVDIKSSCDDLFLLYLMLLVNSFDAFDG